VRDTFKQECKDPDKYVIFANRGISAFLKLLKSILKHSKKRLTETRIRKYLSALKSNWKKPWETKKLVNSYVGSQGWSDFHHDLVKTIRRKIKDFKP